MRYLIRQRFFSLTDSFTIKDENGIDLYQCQRQLLSFGKKLRIFDMQGNELCYIEQQIFRFLPEYYLYISGELVANVKKKFAIFKHDFTIDSKMGQYYVDGDIFAHEFDIYKNGLAVAHVSKRFFTLRDTYGVDIDDDEEQISNLALAIIIDMVCHDRN